MKIRSSDDLPHIKEKVTASLLAGHSIADAAIDAGISPQFVNQLLYGYNKWPRNNPGEPPTRIPRDESFVRNLIEKSSGFFKVSMIRLRAATERSVHSLILMAEGKEPASLARVAACRAIIEYAARTVDQQRYFFPELTDKARTWLPMPPKGIE